MSKVIDTRLANLRKLIAQWGGPVSLAAKLGYSNASFLAQMAGPNPTRTITEKTARRIEEALDLSPGWLDRQDEPARPADSSDVSVDLVTDAVRLAAAICEDNNIRLPSGKFADAVALIYQDALARGHLDESLARRIINLAK